MQLTLQSVKPCSLQMAMENRPKLARITWMFSSASQAMTKSSFSHRYAVLYFVPSGPSPEKQNNRMRFDHFGIVENAVPYLGYHFSENENRMGTWRRHVFWLNLKSRKKQGGKPMGGMSVCLRLRQRPRHTRSTPFPWRQRRSIWKYTLKRFCLGRDVT